MDYKIPEPGTKAWKQELIRATSSPTFKLSPPTKDLKEFDPKSPMTPSAQKKLFEAQQFIKGLTR